MREGGVKKVWQADVEEWTAEVMGVQVLYRVMAGDYPDVRGMGAEDARRTQVRTVASLLSLCCSRSVSR